MIMEIIGLGIVILQHKLKTNVVSALSPYIIGTSNQPVKMTANHGLHLSFRSVKEGFLLRSSIVLH